MEIKGTENIEIVVMLLVEVGNVIPDVMLAGNPLAKAYATRALTDEVMALTKFNLKEAKAEFDDFSKDERLAVVQKAKEKFDLDDDGIELVIERGFEIALKWVGILDETVDYAKDVKGLKKAEPTT